MIIDPHVHLRGEEYAEHDFLKKGLDDAYAAGVQAVQEMPNTKPELVDYRSCMDRTEYVDSVNEHGIAHAINIGMTTDLVQSAKALRMAMTHDRVTADKTFYVHSTGDMGILDESVQRRLWQLKGDMGYSGVSMGHFESEPDYDVDHPFNWELPITHSLYQRPETETIQVEKQLRNAHDAGFSGAFYICHVSNPDTITYVNQQRSKVDFPIITEMTWHHMLLNHDDYTTHGNLVKMNPPLVSRDKQEQNLEHVLKGNVDIIGTDHAPHSLEKKTVRSNKVASGIPALPFWPKGLSVLRTLGISDQLLQDMTFDKANVEFWDGQLVRSVDGFPPELLRTDQDRWQSYGFNPFSRIYHEFPD